MSMTLFACILMTFDVGYVDDSMMLLARIALLVLLLLVMFMLLLWVMVPMTVFLLLWIVR